MPKTSTKDALNIYQHTAADRQLITALEQLDLAKARKALQKGANPNAPLRIYQHPKQNNFYYSVLMFALETYPIRDRLARVKLIKLLLQHGADPNSHSDRGHTPLMVAIQTGSKYTPQLARALLQAGAQVNSTCQCTYIDGMSCGNTALALLVAQRLAPQVKLETVVLLLTHGADVNAACPLGCAVPYTLDEPTETRLATLLPHYFMTPKNGSMPDIPEHIPEVVELLLRAGATIEGEYLTNHPWILAAQAKISESK